MPTGKQHHRGCKHSGGSQSERRFDHLSMLQPELEAAYAGSSHLKSVTLVVGPRDSALRTTECQKTHPRCWQGSPSCYPAWNPSTKISTLTRNSLCRKRGPRELRRTIFVGLDMK